MLIFDAHFHVIDPRFPIMENEGFVPGRFAASDYRAIAQPLGFVGGSVVSASFQAMDQTYLLAALRSLGEAFVGVTQLPISATDAEILHLNAAGVRAARINVHRGPSIDTRDLKNFAVRIHDLCGWHVEVYADGRQIMDLFDTLAVLPKVVLDHLGLTREGWPAVLRLVERGASVKAAGFGRLDFDPAPAIREIARANPDALLFGSDLPSTRAARPFRREDIDLVVNALDPEDAQRALYTNAVALYRPELSRRPTPLSDR